MKLSTRAVDVAIIGAGLVGLSAALTLQRQGYQIVLIEQTAEDREDKRGIALAPSSQQLLSELEVWQAVRAQTTVIESIHISATGTWGHVLLDQAQHNASAPLGYTIEAAHLQAVLRAHLQVSILRPARVQQASLHQNHWQLDIEHEEVSHVTASLVVAADGMHSGMRARFGLQGRQTAYGASALVTTIKAARASAHRAYERFTPEGVCALLPVQDRFKCVWIIPTSAVADFDIQDACQRALGKRLGPFFDIGAVHTFPLAAYAADNLIAARALLLGNAATSLSPVAAQGLNLALRDVAALKSTNRIPREYRSVQSWLGRYAASRLCDHTAFRCMTDVLHRAFEEQRFLSTKGLQAVSLVPCAQTLITRFGTGCLL